MPAPFLPRGCLGVDLGLQFQVIGKAILLFGFKRDELPLKVLKYFDYWRQPVWNL